MKTLIRNALLSLLIATALVLAVPFVGERDMSYAQSVSLTYFHSSLAPYGRWETVGAYGEVWIPARVSVGWQPYTVGHWVDTEYGWTWVSHDPWGDLPYHYGTWVRIRHHGWAWVPGYVWGPAWVTWRYSDAYVGWAPIPPTLVITSYGYAGPPVVVAGDFFVFVPVHRFVGVEVTGVRIPVERNVTIIRGTRNVTSFRVVGGTVRNTAIPVSHVERAGRVRVQRADINVVNTKPARIEAAGKGQGDRIQVAGPRAKQIARLEERSNTRGREGQNQAPSGISRGAGSNRDAGPVQRKGAAIEEKRDQRLREGKGRPDISSSRPEIKRGAPEAHPGGPAEKKAGRFEEKGKQHEKPSEPARVSSRQRSNREQYAQTRKDRGEKSQEPRKEFPRS